MIHELPDCKVIDKVYDICKENDFDELDESEDWINIEFVGEYEWIKTNDYDYRNDYFKAVEKENRKNIHPNFLKCWDSLQDINREYNVFEDWGWYVDDYIVYYLFFTDDFKEKLFEGGD